MRLVMLGVFSLTRTSFAAENSSIARGEKTKQLNTTHAGEGPAWHAPSLDLYFTGGDRITRFDASGACMSSANLPAAQTDFISPRVRRCGAFA